MAAAVAVMMGTVACGHKADNSAEVETIADNEITAEETIGEEPAPAIDDAAGQTAEEVIAETAPASTDYITTPSGLKYKVIKKGTGKSPKATDTVTVNYTGTLTNGTKFDSSYDHGGPISFPLNRVIPGWTEGLQLMQEGATYEFYIPAKLAYGERGAGAAVPPNSDLIFEVELIEVQ